MGDRREDAPRTYDALTPTGRAALADFRQLWPQFAAGISQILTTGASDGVPGDDVVLTETPDAEVRLERCCRASRAAPRAGCGAPPG